MVSRSDPLFDEGALLHDVLELSFHNKKSTDISLNKERGIDYMGLRILSNLTQARLDPAQEPREWGISLLVYSCLFPDWPSLSL